MAMAWGWPPPSSTPTASPSTWMGTAPGTDPLFALFNPPVTGETTFTGSVMVFAVRIGDDAYLLSEVLASLDAQSARLQVFDEAYEMSGDVTVPVRVVEEVGFGETCDAAHACYLGMMCGGGATCVATPEMASLCGGATVIALEPPVDTTVSETVTGTLAAGHGIIESSCGHTPGDEALFDVAVPAGAFDLIATTDLDGTGETDTLIHTRTICVDLSTEVAGGCNDDIAAMGRNVRSRIELQDVAAGTYTLFVQPFGHPPEEPVPFEVMFSLRPVLDAGATCDPAGVDNRCTGGACPADPAVCP